MRRVASTLGALVVVASVGCAFPLDGELKLTDARAAGTHNSYHIAAEDPVSPDVGFTHPTLSAQLDAGARQLELDIHLRQGELLEVFHIPALDEDTHCRLLRTCLDEIAAWSLANETHMPILIWIEPKDLFLLDSTLIPLSGHLDQVDRMVREVFPRVITPDEVQGDAATLRAAVVDGGWPTLGQLRGRVLFALNETQSFRDELLGLDAAIFAQAGDETEDIAAVLKFGDPRGREDALRELVEQGFLLTVTADGAGVDDEDNDARRAATFATGAHYLSSDFLDEMGLAPSCNPVNSPEACSTTDIE